VAAGVLGVALGAVGQLQEAQAKLLTSQSRGQVQLAGPAPVTPAGTPGDATSYAFLSHAQDGDPTRWDPCTPIAVLLNPSGAPGGAVEDLLAALAQITTATGLPITYLGTTDLAPTTQYTSSHVEGYDGYPPVLLAWVTPESGVLGEREAGRAYTLHTADRVVAAMAVFNSALETPHDAASGTPGSRAGLYLHELGHVVGLDHVDDEGQVMHSTADALATLAAGDLTGLAALGAPACPRAS